MYEVQQSKQLFKERKEAAGREEQSINLIPLTKVTLKAQHFLLKVMNTTLETTQVAGIKNRKQNCTETQKGTSQISYHLFRNLNCLRSPTEM